MAFIIGNEFNNSLYGTSSSDTIIGKGGDDILWGGWRGNDSLYGDEEEVNFSLTSTGTNEYLGGTIVMNTYAYNFGHDTLYSSKHSSLLVGDVGDINFTLVANGGPGYLAGGIGTHVAEYGNNFNLDFGDDKIYGHRGHDTLIGDVNSYTLDLTSNGDAGYVSGVIELNNFNNNYGADYIKGRSGNDTIVGDTADVIYQFKVVGGSEVAAGRIRNDHINTYGHDTLYGNNGYDTIYGDIASESMNLLAVGGNDGGDNVGSYFDNFKDDIFGNDFLSGGSKNDTLFGDAGDITFDVDVQGGNGVRSGQFIFNNTTSFSDGGFFRHFGADTINGDKNNDVLVGDVGELRIHFNSDGGDGYQSGQIDYNVLTDTFGADTLNGGSHDDQLMGDADLVDIHIDIKGGVGDVSGSFKQTPLTQIYADDVLNGGSSNDSLIGDMKTFNLTLEATGGSGDNTGIIQGNTFSTMFGADTVNGESGNDWLVGDAETVNVDLMATPGSGASSGIIIGNTIDLAFGNDDLTGGDGADSFFADPINISLSAIGLNTLNLTFGNDVMNGGGGDDTFNFLIADLDGDSQFDGLGHDVIEDLTTIDTLAFHGVSNLTELGDAVADVDDNGTDVTITFNDLGAATSDGLASTLVLEGIGDTTFTSLTALANSYQFDFI